MIRYFERNLLCNQNKAIKAKYVRLGYKDSNNIYIGVLHHYLGGSYCTQDFIDIMSYFDCVGFEVVTKEEAQRHATIPCSGYEVFLHLTKVRQEEPEPTKQLCWFCKKCKLLNNDCEGCFNHTFSNCVYREI